MIFEPALSQESKISGQEPGIGGVGSEYKRLQRQLSTHISPGLFLQLVKDAAEYSTGLFSQEKKHFSLGYDFADEFCRQVAHTRFAGNRINQLYIHLPTVKGKIIERMLLNLEADKRKFNSDKPGYAVTYLRRLARFKNAMPEDFLTTVRPALEQEFSNFLQIAMDAIDQEQHPRDIVELFRLLHNVFPDKREFIPKQEIIAVMDARFDELLSGDEYDVLIIQLLAAERIITGKIPFEKISRFLKKFPASQLKETVNNCPTKSRVELLGDMGIATSMRLHFE